MINKKALENNKLLQKQKVYVWCIIGTTVGFGVETDAGAESSKILQVWKTQLSGI